MNPGKKGKNVLITYTAYEMLINDYKIPPMQLLAKPPVLEDRIKSPKTNRFIHIGSVAYLKLLNEEGYTEEQLLLRRDGFILSPDTQKLVKVFSKTFNMLLESHSLEELLKLPRVQRGDEKIGVGFNNIVNKENKPGNPELTKVVVEDEVINLDNMPLKKKKEKNDKEEKKEKPVKDIKKKEEKKEKKEKKEEKKEKQEVNENIKENIKENRFSKLMTPKTINDLIVNSITPVTVYSSATSYQTNDEDINDGEERKQAHAFHCAACTFTKGQLTSFYEGKEYRIYDNSILYGSYTHGPLAEKVTSLNEHTEFLQNENENTLINIKIDDLDLLSLQQLLKKNKNVKEELIDMVNDKFQEFESNEQLFKMIKLHLWFISNAILLQCPIKFTKMIEQLVNENDETDYENFEKIKKAKLRLQDETKNCHQYIINYLQEKL